MMSSRILARRINSALERSLKANAISGSTRSLSTVAAEGKWEKPVTWVLAGAAVVVASIGSSRYLNGDTATTSMDAFGTLPLGPTIEVQMPDPILDPILEPKSDDSLVEEPVTGITFPPIFKSKQLLGVGVRKKYHFVNVYAVALYGDPKDFQGLKPEEHEKVLLDPSTPRTLRIVMNRTVTMEQVIAALLEVVEPRMHGKDLHALEYFGLLRDYGDLHKGEDVVFHITDDAVEVGLACSPIEHVTKSKVFARAVCDVYFGEDAISPTVKASALAGLADV